MRIKNKLGILAGLLLLLWLIGGCTAQRSAKFVNEGDRAMLAGNYEAAAKSYKQTGRLKETYNVKLRLATALVKSGKYNQALSELECVPQGSPKSKSSYLRAVCYLGLNDVANAESNIEQALQGDPDDSLALALLGRIKFLQRQYPQSIEAYKAALATSSEESVRTIIYYNLAMAQLSAGRLVEADGSFGEYLVKQNFVTKEDNKIAGAIAYAVGDNQRALRHWQKLSTKDRQDILNAIADESEMYGLLAAAN